MEDKTINEYLQEIQDKNYDNSEINDLYYSNYNFNN